MTSMYRTLCLVAATIVVVSPAHAETPARLAHEAIETFSLSAANGRPYEIVVATPTGPAPAAGYPVVYVLDPHIMFGAMTESVRLMARRQDVGEQSVVVGIGYPAGADPRKERAIDYTPAFGSQPNRTPGTGGAEGFLTFVHDTLKPAIGKRWKIDSKREMLFGHSLGGLFTLYTLINRPDTFDTYVAASPSIWFEDGMVKRGNFRGRLGPKMETQGLSARVLITVGEYEQDPDPDFPPESPRDLQQRTQVDNAHEFAGWLAGLPGIEAKFIEVEGLDHGSVIPAAIGHGVHFAYSRTAKMPVPAPKPAEFNNSTGIPVPDAPTYMRMTDEDRYRLRLRIRALPEAQHKAWNDRFQYQLGAGLTYDQHRRLHEERVRMDEKYGTAPVDE